MREIIDRKLELLEQEPDVNVRIWWALATLLTEAPEINKPHPDIKLFIDYLDSYLTTTLDYPRIVPTNGRQFISIFNQYIQDPSNAIPSGFEHLDFLAFVFMYCEESLRSTKLDIYTSQIFITETQKHLQRNLERTLPGNTKTSPETIQKFEHYLTLVTQYAEPLILALKAHLTDGLVYKIPDSAYSRRNQARRISLAFLTQIYVILHSDYAAIFQKKPNLIAERVITSLGEHHQE